MADEIDTTGDDGTTEETTAETATTEEVTDGGNAQPETLLDNAGDEETKEATAPADWPDDWRAKLAGDDEAALKRLNRFQSPANVFKSFRALEQKFSSGEFHKGLSDEPSDEELAAYREANGIPASPEEYDTTLPDGLVIGDEDKPIVDEFLAIAHAKHLAPDTVKDMLGWYYQAQDAQLAAQAEQDKSVAQESEDALRAEWGNEYRANLNIINGFMDGAPEGLKDALLHGRMADGTPVGSNPQFLTWITEMARTVNPAATVLPGSTGDPAKSVEARIAEIEKVMREDRPAYDKDSAMRSEYRDLLDARTKLDARAA